MGGAGGKKTRIKVTTIGQGAELLRDKAFGSDASIQVQFQLGNTWN